MTKFRALIEPQIVEVEADNEHDAQLWAFAKLVRALSPSDFVVWQPATDDEWRDEAKTEVSRESV